MKYLFTTLFVILSYASAYTQANTKLSNLVAPTGVNQHLLPNLTNARDLGSSTMAWRNTFLRGDLYLDGTRFVSNAPGTNSLNAFVGSSAGNSVTRGTHNTAVGHTALFRDTSGSYNTALGASALYNNTNGFNNVAIGSSAMRDNTTGFYNIAIGDQSLLYNNGSGNIAIGLAAMPYNTRGRYNVAIGANALHITSTSEYNTAVGSLAANSYNNGYNNVFVGANTDVNGTGYYNVIVIGQAAIGTNVSQVTMGNPATSSYRAYAGWSNISDGRYKKNLKEDVPGISFIRKLRPVTYTLDASGLHQFLIKNKPKNEHGSAEAETMMQKALREKETEIQAGFVAQEVEKAAEELNFKFSGVEVPANENDLYALKYSDFVVPLVKAVQEQQQEIEKQQKEIELLTEEITLLKEMITTISVDGGFDQKAGWIKQNTPNPVSSGTTIQYYIPTDARAARILLINAKGQQLKIYNVSGRGTLNFSVATLPSGTYTYSLIIDGETVMTRKMVIAR